MARSSELLRLYQELLKEASKFHSYYYRSYFTRKIKCDFEKKLEDGELVRKSEEMLQMLRRQTVIDNLYHKSKLVIE